MAGRAARIAGVAALIALLYGLADPGANRAEAAPWPEVKAAAEAARAGDMARMFFRDAPAPRHEAAFTDATGAETSLAAFAGRIVLLNFWATWCAPCRAEMPALDRLAAAVDPADIAVIAISADRGKPEKPKAFLEEIGVERLAFYQDASNALIRKVGTPGLPVTLLLDREGREIARLIGEAHWDGPEAQALLARVAELTAQ